MRGSVPSIRARVSSKTTPRRENQKHGDEDRTEIGPDEISDSCGILIATKMLRAHITNIVVSLRLYCKPCGPAMTELKASLHSSLEESLNRYPPDMQGGDIWRGVKPPRTEPRALTGKTLCENRGSRHHDPLNVVTSSRVCHQRKLR